MKKRRIVRGVLLLSIFAIMLYLWEKRAEETAHFTPDYPMMDLQPYIEKDVLAGQEYTLLFEQTGLGRSAIDALWTNDRREELIDIQHTFFEPVMVKCEHNTIISKEEALCLQTEKSPVYIPVVEEGDILITFNCHVLGWRVGHAGIVVDAEKRQVLEARVLGSDSAILDLSHWQEYPAFTVLRIKGVPWEKRKEIATYAKETLLRVPYSLSAGIFGKKEGKAGSPEGTQCSHLVWCAFWHYGYDLDSDGGRIVTPGDLFDSPLLEVVQNYGMNPDMFLDKY